MATTAFVDIHLYTGGDIALNLFNSMVPNLNSLVEIDVIELATGMNEISQPGAHVGGGNLPTGFTINGVLLLLPPTNTNFITLKSNDLDSTGLHLARTGPTFIGLDPTQTHGFYLENQGPTPVVVSVIWI